ncbi:aldo/keto reductase [Bradyrhizobium sp. 150]|uniref:aldo/keto reductase n=1 Tax=Bradyrhizobium sp. 150 TaxID=2782625 RepID=UPI00201C7F10|nr:aldo/keto reductase [Bradyrhizobium sp. 150]
MLGWHDVGRISAGRSISPAVISVAWVLAKTPMIRVIPNATSLERLKANARAADLIVPKREITDPI